jgi:hypothetical protein
MISEILATNPTNRDLLQIIDARPRVNARANQVKVNPNGFTASYRKIGCWGWEFEQLSQLQVVISGYWEYPCDAWLSIETEGLHNSWRVSYLRYPPIPVDLANLMHTDHKWWSSVESSAWFYHSSCILKSVEEIVTAVEKRGTSVLVHCSDGIALTVTSYWRIQDGIAPLNWYRILVSSHAVTFPC